MIESEERFRISL
ncbi:Protein of unknown function [Bacillus mycoides]|nr:Protein of unknown function [Bacillus mycoides]